MASFSVFCPNPNPNSTLPSSSIPHHSSHFTLSPSSSLRRGGSSSLLPFRSSPSPRVSSFHCKGRTIVASSVAVGDESSVVKEVVPNRVSAVLFDMDGVLCDSEERSRLAAVDLFAEFGVKVFEEDFFPFMGTGEANFLGGVAKLYAVKDFNVTHAKSRFFQIYLEKYAKPNSGLGFPGAGDLVVQCRNAGLKVALASSADRLKIDANLAAAGLSVSLFDAIVSADAFENLKPAPDIFLAAAKALGVLTNECVVVEDALAGLQAAKAAGMRCIAVTTTLSSDKLLQENPSLIKKDIGDIKLDEILNLPGPGEY